MLHVDNEEMPSRAKTVGAQVVELKKLCLKRTLIIILDDICKSKKYLAYRRSNFLTLGDSTHELSFACIDLTTPSRLLVTTRIKGIIQEATEVELELLGLQESVELLAGVAEIDASILPPECLEIAQLCGRLPLCLSIVGKMIKTFGSGWEEEVPAILKSDMSSLTDAQGAQPMNLHARVIKSGSTLASFTDNQSHTS